jgi:hypothetical protein
MHTGPRALEEERARAGASTGCTTRAFAEATTTPDGEAGLLEAARALALTVLELARCRSRREAVAAGWEAGREAGE